MTMNDIPQAPTTWCDPDDVGAPLPETDEVEADPQTVQIPPAESFEVLRRASEEELRVAVETAMVDHVIKSLPDGMNTILGESADNISAGERQLLTIARAMLVNAPITILDEATSNVDTRTERLIQQAMDKLVEGRTSFVIAHRLSTIRNADLILVMDHGDIVESGTHDSLLEQNGFYAKLYNAQFAH